MTECNAQPLRSSSLDRKNVVADFGGGRLTSDAGGLLLREADRRLGLTRALGVAGAAGGWEAAAGAAAGFAAGGGGGNRASGT